VVRQDRAPPISPRAASKCSRRTRLGLPASPALCTFWRADTCRRRTLVLPRSLPFGYYPPRLAVASLKTRLPDEVPTLQCPYNGPVVDCNRRATHTTRSPPVQGA